MNPHSSPPLIAQDPESSTPRRLIVVSNRLPVRLDIADDTWSSQPSCGGLASAVGGLETTADSVWVGWPGCPVPATLRDDVTDTLRADKLVPIFLTESEETSYYRDYCNDVLWPLFHYFTDKAQHESGAWETYQQVNAKFAKRILEECRPGDQVWIHDFHLMLLPALLRDARPDLEIGFFLHIPWPSSEIFRLLPQRDALLRGLLGADFISFHTNDYAHHFRTTCQRVLGVDSDPGGISFENRRVGIGRHPIGIDTEHFRDLAEGDETLAIVQDLRRRYQGRKVILGVERLDYTKGIPLKLRAFERFLEADPTRAETVTLLQIIVPSRLDSTEYQGLKAEIEAYVGRINGKFGGPGYTPIEYMHRSVTPEKLVALYSFADVALVTPIRDGMNLVAQEFVLCQARGTGMLILSEFAGAAHVLGEAILINPWNTESTADAITTALEMPAKERLNRMRPMIARVEELDCKRWARRFLADLAATAQQSRALRDRTCMSGDEITKLTDSFVAADRRVILLDYDGTLRELTPTPEMASPTTEILDLVTALATVPGTAVHIVSGRPHSTLDDWFGHLPIHLSAEHGSTHRAPDGEWELLQSCDLSWMDKVRGMLAEVCREVPGTSVENKQFSIAWHYRMADLDYGLWRARELILTLEQEVTNLGVEVISGNKVIEVRAAGVNKGNYARRALAGVPEDTFVLGIGDDRTDADLYRAMPNGAVSIHVGGSADDATFTIESPERVRRLLHTLEAAATLAVGCEA